ncbi:MAG: tol-pal system YbgF family protein [Polyangiales bacterium]
MTTTEEERDPVLMVRLVLDDHAGPAPRIARERAAAMVEHALLELPVAEVPARGPSSAFALLRGLAMAAAALLVLVGGAAAARLLYERLAPPVPAPAKVRAPAPAAPSVARAPVVLGPEVPVEIVEDEDAPPAGRPHAAPVAQPEKESAAPDDLLQKANRLRALGKFQQAAATYSLVYQRAPGSLSGYVAEVAAGSIELEHLAHAGRARRLFEKALQAQPSGALDLEARQGLALAARDLGDAAAEAGALRELVARHPGSPAAKRAELRLRELAKAAR